MKMLETIPALPVIDIKSAVSFYHDKFGFSVRHQEIGFAIMQRDLIEIHLWASSDELWKSRFRAVLDGSLKVTPEQLDCPVVSGAESFLAGTASCRIRVEGIDELYAEYKQTGVLYDSDVVVETTDWGTREFPTLDLHRNLLTFFGT